MNVIPAIDIRGGHAVRLHQGRFDTETVFDDDPVHAARRWVAAGATRLHVVDLDGARGGRPANLMHVAAIARLGVPVQCGGGIRDAAAAARLLEAGVDRVILGTAAVEDITFVEALCHEYGAAVVVSLDARGGYLATEGWTRTSGVRAVDRAAALEGAGVPRFVYTDVVRDGTMTAPNLGPLRTLIERVTVPVIASGGVAAAEQLPALAATGAEAAIIGRALYDGRVDLRAAIEVAASAAEGPAG